ncbi:chain-length determining protein [Pseudomaricurvus alcaniphilus]|uniref:chain-length determining protein n=1 Tax=Pseudomaricurvus alcaniphilus TaxID=1166482 RepID=UPI00140C2B9D|nr:chain-length determining protein [Pseudomaricurvus alcaniphilus]NHN37599.1 chain-length determining protein [Pseudomaricurvus alcaniphilus]
MSKVFLPPALVERTRSFALRYPHWAACIVATFMALVYWSLWASDRYISETNVVLESPQIAAPTMSFESLFSGNTGNAGDMLLLRDYMLSVDMLRKIDSQLDFRGHFSGKGIDFLSSLGDRDAPMEDLHEYYLKRVAVELDDYAQVLRVKVAAFDPAMAHRIAEVLLQEGEAHMNSMGQRLAEEQVSFLEKQVEKLGHKLDSARAELLDYQNEHGLVSPTGTVETISAVVASLEGQLATTRAKRSAMLSYLSPRSAEILRAESEIEALQQQIGIEQARMAQQSGGALNTVSSEYQKLDMQMKFALESYAAALAALQNTRIEAARKLKQVSVLQSPTVPEYAVEPQRLYNITVFTIITFFLGLILQMLVMIVKDHRD